MRSLVLLAALTVCLPAAAQDWQAEPLYSQVVLQAGFTSDPHQIGVLAGGADPNPAAGAECVGYVNAAQPDVTVTYAANTDYDLVVAAESAHDTALLIRSPDGRWHCSDDTGESFDPSFQFAIPQSGTYAVWVGTYQQGAAQAMLHVSEVRRSTPAPDHRGFPRRARLTLEPGFEPMTFDVTSGGPDATMDGPGCVGRIDADQPDVVVDYAGRAALAVSVESASDTALLIRTPDGRWLCDDDSAGGLNPILTIGDAPRGAYAIWVATHGGPAEDAMLHIAEQ